MRIHLVVLLRIAGDRSELPRMSQLKADSLSFHLVANPRPERTGLHHNLQRPERTEERSHSCRLLRLHAPFAHDDSTLVQHYDLEVLCMGINSCEVHRLASCVLALLPRTLSPGYLAEPQ